MADADIHKLISLTFDENPKIRLDAAAKLSKIDDPAALFALMELSYDKDLEVKNFAQNALEKKKSEEEEVMSFAEIFSTKKEEAASVSPDAVVPGDKKEKMLSPITKLFEKKLGKQRADRVRQRMMPAIEKVYMKSTSQDKAGENEPGRKAIQEFLTSYLDAISDLESIATPDGHVIPDSDQPEAVHHEGGEVPSVAQLAVTEIEEVSRDHDVSGITQEVYELEERERKEAHEEETFTKLPDTPFKKAYEAMLASNGDEDVMKKELRRMQKNFDHDLKLAYSLARRKFREVNITHVSKIKDGMRNVNTDLLSVTGVETIAYEKGKQKLTATRVMVQDAKEREAVVYLFDGRGSWIKEGMKIKVIKGQAKSFKFSGETALTVGSKGNVYIVL